MKNLICSFTIAFMISPALLFAQWSPNTTSTNTPIYRTGNTGVGLYYTTSPEAVLHVAQELAGFSTPDGPPSYLPLFRLERRTTKGEISYNTWDIDVSTSFSNGLYFNRINNVGQSEEEMKLDVSGLTLAGRLVVNGSTLSLGSANVRTSMGNNSGAGGKHGSFIAFGGTRHLGSGFIGGSPDQGKTAIMGYDDGTIDFITGTPGGFSNSYDNTRLKISPEGLVGIGITEEITEVLNANESPYLLYVKGGIITEEIKVETGWCDYVFEEDYNLLPLTEVENHIADHGHLHNTPSAAEVETNGLELKSMTVNQQEKIEELFLHVIELDKKMKALEEENKELKMKLTNSSKK